MIKDYSPKIIVFSRQENNKINKENLYENLRMYVKQITMAQEEERLRIARELHDTTIQSLIAVNHQSERFLANNKNLNMIYIRFLLQISEQIKTIIREVRSLSSNLRPSILDNLGLMPSIQYLTDQIENTYGINTNLEILGSPYRFMPEVEVSIFRVVQEALQNVVRHSEATEVDITIDFGLEAINLVIRDNGKGIMSLPCQVDELIRQGKLGLVGMYERVRLIAGELTLSSCPGKGTVITMTIPVTGNLMK